MAKASGPMWWKMLRHQRTVIDAVEDEAVGRGLKAAFAYFEGEDVSEYDLDKDAFLVFCVMRPYIDEAIADYEMAVENGRKGGKPKREPAEESPF